jgi:hypothetical protein
MSVSAKEAAELVGMSKQGIIRACRAGKISAQKNVQGEWEIEPVELFRVYQPVSTLSPTFTPDQSESYQEKIQLLERMIADRDDRINKLDDTINKLLDRLAAQQQVTLLLEDKQHPRQWWQRILRRG